MSILLQQVTQYLDQQLAEASSVEERYKMHSESAKKLLDGIHEGLKKHAATGKKDWGHVGDVEHIHKQLQKIHDMVHRTGEYAK